MKKAVLLVVSGTSCGQAAQVLDGLCTRMASRFADAVHAIAYSSKGVRAKLEKEGRAVDSPAQALCRLRKDGVTHVAVKPLHMVAGMEYAELLETVNRARSGNDAFEGVRIGRPLLESKADVTSMLQALREAIPGQSESDAALVLVMHGSTRKGTQKAIEAADAVCRQLDRHMFMGAMICKPDRDDVVESCKRDGVRHVQLAPFMITAGYSARHEIGGDEPGSWKRAFEDAGISCAPALKGLAEYDAIVEMWFDRIGELLTGVEDITAEE